MIIDGYDAIGAAAEEGERNGRGAFVDRWVTLAAAVRGWAVSTPHEYALLYGSPVPGYRAPSDTIAPAQRVNSAALRVVTRGFTSGEIDARPRVPMKRAVKADLQNVRAVAPELPEEVAARALQAWSALFGSITWELFGHFTGVVSDFEAYSAHQARRAATMLASP